MYKAVQAAGKTSSARRGHWVLALVAVATLGACGPQEETEAPAAEMPAVPEMQGPWAPELLNPEAADADMERTVTAQALPANHYILFIRGLDPQYNYSSYFTSYVPMGCSQYWTKAIQYFTDRGWGTRLRTVGIYSKQSNCYVNLADVVPTQPTNLIEFKGTNPLTNSTQIGALGHRLAWWIYNNYTSKGYTVSLVGHSLGGLVARAAIGGAIKQYNGFPPPLLVKSLVLLATPNNGASTSWLGGLVGCDTQCDQMEPGSLFLNNLNTSMDTGNSGVPYRLNLIGSNDYVVGDVRSGAYGGTGTSLYFISPAYDHQSIIEDLGTDSTASIGYWADRTQAYTLNPPKYTGQPRSLAWAFNWATAQ